MVAFLPWISNFLTFLYGISNRANANTIEVRKTGSVLIGKAPGHINQ